MAVAGAGFGTDCNDTGGAGPPLGSPARHIEVAFVEGLDRRVLGFARADDDYSLTLWVTVPIDAVPGAASLDVGGSTASIWIDGAPVASPTPTPSVQQARGYRAPTKVSRTGQFVMVGLLGAVAGAGLVVVARKVRDRGDMRGVDRATG